MTDAAITTAGPWAVEDLSGDLWIVDPTARRTMARVWDRPEQAPIAALLAAAPELRDALRACEWADYYAAHLRYCPLCRGRCPDSADAETPVEIVGHREDCQLAVALAKADGR